MALYTFRQLENLPMRKTLAKSLLLQEPPPLTQPFDIFLSHSYTERDQVLKI